MPVSAALSLRAVSASASEISGSNAVKADTTDAALSSGVFPADLHGMRRRLPDEWAGFLRQHFNGDVRLIRTFFDCDDRTARDWLAGRHGVNGAPLLMLIRSNAAARAFFMGDAA